MIGESGEGAGRWHHHRLTSRDKSCTNATMLRRLSLVAVMAALLSCATAPGPPVWYVLSPTPTETYPHGNINSPLTSWQQLRQFATSSECENAINQIHNELHRPVSCIASNDPRL